MDVYPETTENIPRRHFRLRSMICVCSGCYYHAFVKPKLPKPQRWMMVHGSVTTDIGGWADVIRMCARCLAQPSVLFFEADV